MANFLLTTQVRQWQYCLSSFQYIHRYLYYHCTYQYVLQHWNTLFHILWEIINKNKRPYYDCRKLVVFHTFRPIKELGETMRHLLNLVKITFSANVMNKEIRRLIQQQSVSDYFIGRYWDIKHVEVFGLLFDVTTRHIQMFCSSWKMYY